MIEARTKAAATVAALTIIGAASPAQATTVIDIPLSEILANGETYNGSFDISGLLNDGTDSYEVTAATLQLSGTSDYGQTGTAIGGYYTYSYSVFGGYYTYSYSCGGWWSYSTCYATGSYYYTAYATAPYYVGVDQTADSLLLSAGDQSNWGYDSASGNPSSYYGSLVTLLLLDSDGLAAANASGGIDFTAFASTNTNIHLTDAQVSLELQTVPGIGGVPEPATWAMMLTGFAAVGAGLRRRRRRASRVAVA